MRWGQPAPKLLVAFGDPLFWPGAEIASAEPVPATARGFASYFRGADPDKAALSSLQPLPDSADEVRAIAGSLGDGALLVVGREAREAEVILGSRTRAGAETRAV